MLLSEIFLEEYGTPVIDYNNHDVEYVKNLYHVLHDMDYFLLRYSPEAVAPYISLDTSTVTKYYGILEVYK